MEDVSSGGDLPWSSRVEVSNRASSMNPYLKHVQRRRYVTENTLDREDPSAILAGWYASYDWLSAHYDEESLEDVGEVSSEMGPSVVEKSMVDETSFVLTLATDTSTSDVQRHRGMPAKEAKVARQASANVATTAGAEEDTIKTNPQVCTLL